MTLDVLNASLAYQNSKNNSFIEACMTHNLVLEAWTLASCSLTSSQLLVPHNPHLSHFTWRNIAFFSGYSHISTNYMVPLSFVKASICWIIIRLQQENNAFLYCNPINHLLIFSNIAVEWVTVIFLYDRFPLFCRMWRLLVCWILCQESLGMNQLA